MYTNFNFSKHKNNHAQKPPQQLNKLKFQLQNAKILSKTINNPKDPKDPKDKKDPKDQKNDTNTQKLIENVEETINCIDIDAPEISKLNCAKESMLNEENLDNSSQNEHMNKLIKLINKILNTDNDAIFYDLIKDASECQEEEKLYKDISLDNNLKNILKYECEQQRNPNLLTNNIELLNQYIKNIETENVEHEENIVLKITNLETETEKEIKNEENEVFSQNTMSKKSSIDYSKINKINNMQNKDILSTEITSDVLLGKMNNMVKKVYQKIEVEISKDVVNYSDILFNKNKKNSITNIICLIILDKIDKLIS